MSGWYWFCESCGDEIDNKNVTNDERHDRCGNEVSVLSGCCDDDLIGEECSTCGAEVYFEER